MEGRQLFSFPSSSSPSPTQYGPFISRFLGEKNGPCLAIIERERSSPLPSGPTEGRTMTVRERVASRAARAVRTYLSSVMAPHADLSPEAPQA